MLEHWKVVDAPDLGLVFSSSSKPGKLDDVSKPGLPALGLKGRVVRVRMKMQTGCVQTAALTSNR
jgi:hypothetical protein